MSDPLPKRLARHERELRRMRLLVGVLLVLVVLMGGALAFLSVPELHATSRVIRAQEIVVEDPNGVVRARLGGDLPDAVYDGVTVDRGPRAAGLVIYDRRGHERGGYVTFEGGNALLTLDAGREGDHRQTAYFVAEADGATALKVWSGDDHVELRAGSDEGARFNAVRDGDIVFQMPTIEHPEETPMCRELRSLRERHEIQDLMEACRKRMSAEGCRLCLEAR